MALSRCGSTWYASELSKEAARAESALPKIFQLSEPALVDIESEGARGERSSEDGPELVDERDTIEVSRCVQTSSEHAYVYGLYWISKDRVRKGCER